MSTASSALAHASAEPPAHTDARWRLGDRFRLASLSIAGAFALLALYLAYLGDPRPAVLVIVGGAGIGVAIGRVAYALPRALDAPLTGDTRVWSAFALWHSGVTLLALAWRDLVPSAVGVLAGLMLAASATILLGRLVSMLRASPHRLSNAWRLGLALLGPTGVSAVAAGLMLGLSFRAGTYDGLPDVALSLLVFGSLLPAGIVAIALRAPGARA